MTPQEKARATRERNREAQQQKQRKKAEEQKLIRDSLQEILRSEKATPAEKLASSELLMELDRGQAFSRKA